MGDIAATCAERDRRHELLHNEQSLRWHIANMLERIGKKVEERVK
jgi:hypothetical protein